MRTTYIFLIFILIGKTTLSQNLSTIFIDTLIVVYNSDTLINVNKTQLYFVPSDHNDNNVIFSKGDYQIILVNEFSNWDKLPNSNKVKKGKYASINKSDFRLYNKNIKDKFDYYSTSSLTDDCGILHLDIKTISAVNEISNAKCNMKYSLRIFNMAPVDTTNYKTNTREGRWIGKEDGIKQYTVEFKNDKKEGDAEVEYKNGSTIKKQFQNDKEIGLSNEHLKPFRGYTIPSIIAGQCNAR